MDNVSLIDLMYSDKLFVSMSENGALPAYVSVHGLGLAPPAENRIKTR